ncbi:ATP-binding protein [Brasilonema sennae]|uniref:ATP-binding protein n=1 Tax=Brasilonema sennae TaxID=1397703 RepID=UPI001FEA90D8|nr:ATP-binding protein [Brasilonema sennae]
MARSLRIALQHIATIQSVLKENGYPSQQALALELGISSSTVKNFFSGQFIDCLNFIRISQKLKLEWRAIAHRELETQPQGLSAEQYYRLEKKRDTLQQEWNIRTEKVGRIRESLAIETSAADKFKSEQTLLYEEAELECLGHELNQIEAALESPPLKKKIVEKKQPPPPKPKTEETSPFITGSPITHPRYFFGRQKELKRLFDLLKRYPLQNAAIIGKRRIGKTSLLHYLKNITTTPLEQLRSGQKYDWLPHPENHKWIFVDFQDPRMAGRERLLSYILECLSLKVPTPCNLDYFMDIVSDNLHSPTVILLDEIGVGLQRCPELDDGFWESLRSLATNHTSGNLAFVLATHESPIELARNTGHSSPFFNIFGYTATLGALTETEARELIASSPIIFAKEDVEWILQQSQCLPLLLQILCRERLFNLEDGETDDWCEEGLRQIKPFAHLLERNRER